VRIPFACSAGLCLALLSACSTQVRDGAPGQGGNPPMETVYTELSGGGCEKKADPADPNETPFLVCPGVDGYSLIVRRVESGRHSVDVLDAKQRLHPLNYQEFVTRHMSNVTGRAEWRRGKGARQQAPAALIVHVQAREDADDPEEVTQTYVAIAKITAQETCVTDRLEEGTRTEAEIRSLADTARDRRCADALPLDGAGKKSAR
jgi:hypothetical protein